QASAAVALAACLLAGCGRSGLDYKPNPPLVKNGPRFPIKAALMPLRDLTPYGPPPEDASTIELTAAGSGRCPRLSPRELTLDLARELSASGLVKSVEIVDDQWDAARRGDKLLIVGQIEDAGVSNAGPGQKDLSLTIEVRELMRFDAMEPFTNQIWEQAFHQEEKTPAPLSPAVVGGALRRLYGKIASSVGEALKEQARFARLSPKTPRIADPAAPGT
ncbi:MAG: hypothetical protein KGI84_08220, partial [Elusimicrobia bacterium]|nr:hypothetical protein [Elusimicrobiota bacterium]